MCHGHIVDPDDRLRTVTLVSWPDHDITTPGPPTLEEVSDGVWAYVQPDGTWWINNTGFLAAPRGVIVIDTCSTERRTRAFGAAIESVTPAPVRTVVNTHHHGDHTWGNGLFAAATVVAHDNARQEMLAFGPPRPLPFWGHPDWGSLPFEPPFLTFADRVRLHSGDLAAEVIHVGRPAHTTSDSIIWLPERSTLFCGDLIFNGGTPFVLMGSLTGAIAVLEETIAPLHAAVTVPGHGPVFYDRGPLDDTLRYLRFVLDVAVRARAEGVAPLAAALDTDLGDFAGWADRERIVGNLHRAFADLARADTGTSYEAGTRDTGAGRAGSAVDLIAALGDMVTYNGGRPLTCLA